ncbi:plant expansin [Coniophora puteana RWD-64-598 SS2]|uniref:Plant expansin n=1 Tax=Coniophora puteana (strain RWD-64-598) TaxID=741705 RepID=R7SFU8_CONPW|nr:plant expansin [Coniophora puteana RWD-64-598 SS2]EIW74617.1 plant expansin [Coniophora puteana RWD-64-598 SS2]
MYSPIALLYLFLAPPAVLASGGLATSNETSLTKRVDHDDQRMTWFDVGLGACGQISTPDQHIYGTGKFCGREITISSGGKNTTAIVVDSCPGCPQYGLDLSVGLFGFFAPTSDGVIYGDWHFDWVGFVPE